jgi:MYXO-CTERM domain-containing protein
MRRTLLVTGGVALALSLAAPAAHASKKILVYGSGGTTDTAAFPVAPDPLAAVVTVATDAMWRSLSTSDFKSYDALWVDAGDCAIYATGTESTPWVPTQFQALYDTRLTWSAALTGHFEIIGSDEDFHFSEAGANKFVKNSYQYVVSGVGTGLFISTGCMYYTAPADTKVPYLEGIGTFHVTGDGCTDGQVFEIPTHPIVVGVTPPSSTLALTDLSWGCFTHSHYNLTPPSYARVIDIGGTGEGHGVVVAHDVGGCAIDRDCPTGTFCSAPVCLPAKPGGFGCVTGSDCATGKCVDGSCCDTDCTGECEACDVVGSKGKCTPVVGAPHGSRTPCPGGGATCAAICDGKTTTTCAGFPDTKTECGPESCTAGVYTSPSFCDGAGKCVPGTTKKCDAYVCAGPECATACAKPADCAPGYDCVGGGCVPGDAGSKDGGSTDGGGGDAGHVDGGGDASSGDASGTADGSFDDGGDGTGDNAGTTKNGGCGCEVPGSASSNGGAYGAAFAALAALVASRRRRR